MRTGKQLLQEWKAIPAAERDAWLCQLSGNEYIALREAKWQEAKTAFADAVLAPPLNWLAGILIRLNTWLRRHLLKH